MVPVQRNSNQQVMKLVRAVNPNTQNIAVIPANAARQQVVRVVPTNKLGNNANVISNIGHKICGQKAIIVSKAPSSTSNAVDSLVEHVCMSTHSGTNYDLQTHNIVYGSPSNVILNESGVSSQQTLNSKVAFVQPQNHIQNQSQQQQQLVSYNQNAILHQKSSQQQQQLLYSEVFF